MPFNPIVSAPDPRALGLGVLSYFVLALLLGLLVPRLPHSLGTVFLAILLFVPGAVTGFLAKRSPLMHGLLLGALIVIFLGLLFLLAGTWGVKNNSAALRDLDSMAVGGAVLLMIGSSLGAVLGDFLGATQRGL